LWGGIWETTSQVFTTVFGGLGKRAAPKGQKNPNVAQKLPKMKRGVWGDRTQGPNGVGGGQPKNKTGRGQKLEKRGGGIDEGSRWGFGGGKTRGEWKGQKGGQQLGEKLKKKRKGNKKKKNFWK